MYVAMKLNRMMQQLMHLNKNMYIIDIIDLWW